MVRNLLVAQGQLETQATKAFTFGEQAYYTIHNQRTEGNTERQSTQTPASGGRQEAPEGECLVSVLPGGWFCCFVIAFMKPFPS